MRRLYLEGKDLRLIGRSVGIKKSCFEGVWIVQLPSDVHGELHLPAHRLDDAGRGDLVAACVTKSDLDVWPFLKRSALDVDTQTIPIGIRLGTECRNMRLFGHHPVEMIFGEEQIHSVIITKTKKPAFRGKRAVELQIYQWIVEKGQEY